MHVAGVALLALAVLQDPPASASSEPAAAQTSTGSLSRIRQALETQTHSLKLDATQENPPTFRAEIRGRRVESVLDRLDFRPGPMPPGGLYAFEQAQLLGNPWAGRPMIEVNVLPIFEAAYRAISSARSRHAERAAHEAVQRALIELCAAPHTCSSP
jgi:hypothetical protein